MTEYQTIWFNNFLGEITSHDLKNEKELKNLISIINSGQNEHSIQNKVSQIEKDYQEKLKEYETLCKNPSEINKIKDLNSLLILQKELEIVKLLTKYALQNNQLDYDFFINCLNFILILSETLRTRIGQKEINLDKKNYNDDNISRCSYKFCNYKDSCTYNYNKSKNLCYQDHYVHNMVCADIKVLLDYIEQKYGQMKLVLHNKEILKTINTLSFVINHMESELKAKCMYLKDQSNNNLFKPDNEIEQFHFIKLK